MNNSLWLESPDGDLYNLSNAISIELRRVEGPGGMRCDIVARFLYDSVEDPEAIIYSYDTMEKAEEDLARIRGLIKPKLRLRPGATAEKE